MYWKIKISHFADFEQAIIKISHFAAFEHAIIKFSHFANFEKKKTTPLGETGCLGIFFEAITLCHWHSTPASETC